MSTKFIIWIVFAVGLAIPGRMYAQTNLSIFGTITDELHTGVAGVTVTANGPQGEKTAFSNANGYFEFYGLPDGVYTLTFERRGYQGGERGNVIVRAGQPARVDKQLRIDPTVRARGNVAGRVVDPAGQAVAGVRVLAINESTSKSYETATNEEGAYNLEAPIGKYRVEVQATGFKTYLQTDVLIAANQASNLDMSLSVGSVGETVSITANASESTVDSINIARLPIDGRRFHDLLALTVPSADRRSAGGSSINGASGAENRLVLDGIDSKDTLASSAESPFSLSAASEIRVSQTGYQNPQLSNASGLQIDMSVKSGTRKFSGGVDYQLMNEALDGHNFFSLPGFDIFRRHIGSAKLGGPLWKAKELFFFFNYELNRKVESPTFSTVLASQISTLNQQLARLGIPAENLRRFVTKSASDSPLLRLDYNATSDDSFTFQYGFRRDLIRSDLTSALNGTSSTPSTARDVSGRNHYLILHYNRLLSSNLVSESFYSYGSNSISVVPLEPEQPSILIPGLALLGRATNLVEGDGHRQSTHIVSERIEIASGKHRMNVGGQFQFSKNLFRFAAFESGRVIVPGLAALSSAVPVADLFQIGRGGSLVQFNIPKAVVYFRDDIKLKSNLSVSLGLRYKAEFPPSPQQNDVKGWQPTVGLAWDIWGNQTLVLRADYGLYRSFLPPLPLAFQLLMGGQGLQPIAPARRVISIVGQQAASSAFNLFLAGGNIPPGPELATIYKRTSGSPIVQALDVSLAKSLRWNIMLDISYSYRRGSNLLTSTNVNLPRPALINGRADFRDSFVNPNFAQIYQFETTGHSSYHGGSVRVYRGFSSGLSFNALYTFSKAIDDVPFLRTVDLLPTGSFEATPENVFDRRNERAVSDWNPVHRLNTWAIWEVPKPNGRKAGHIRHALGTLFFSQGLRIESGRYFNVVVGSDANHDGNPLTDRPLNVGRNTFLGQPLIQLDVRSGTNIGLTENHRLSLAVQFFNVLNRTNFASYDTVLGQPDLSGLDPRIVSGTRGLQGFDFRHPLTSAGFGLATSTFGPRRVQLEVSYQF